MEECLNTDCDHNSQGGCMFESGCIYWPDEDNYIESLKDESDYHA